MLVLLSILNFLNVKNRKQNKTKKNRSTHFSPAVNTYLLIQAVNKTITIFWDFL